jgi:Bacterial protein of unknown function (DUF937)
VNIVELIKDQISGDVMGGLGRALGKDQATATKATAGAIPALLSVLASLLKSPDGPQKLISALRTFDAGALAEIVSSLRSGNSEPVQQKGGDVLGSLLGPGTLSILVAALSKFSNLDSGSTKGLLSTLLPLILGVISSHFKGKPLDSSSVTDFFKAQASNITAAIPSGLSLAEIPGASALKSTGAEAASGVPAWVYAVAGLVVLGLLGYYIYSQGPQEAAPKPEAAPATSVAPTAKPVDVPDLVADSDIVDLPDQLSKVYTSSIEYLTSVKDVPTAEAAAPKLQGLDATIDRLKPLIDKLPASAKDAIAGVQTKYLSQLKELIAKVLAIPGVGEKLKPLVDGLVTKLSSIKSQP